MIKILILEDEPLQSAMLEAMLGKNNYNVVGKAIAGEEMIEKFQATKPDFLLLDVEILGSKDGIQTGKELMNIRPVPHIYITAHPKEFHRAMMTYPASFFTKPYTEDAVLNAIELAIHNYYGKVASIPGIDFHSDSIWIKERNEQRTIFKKLIINDLLYLKAENAYIEIFNVNSIRETFMTGKISVFEDAIKGKNPYAKIRRVHRSYIVNTEHIITRSNNFIILQGGIEIPISDTYMDNF